MRTTLLLCLLRFNRVVEFFSTEGTMRHLNLNGEEECVYWIFTFVRLHTTCVF